MGTTPHAALRLLLHLTSACGALGCMRSAVPLHSRSFPNTVRACHPDDNSALLQVLYFVEPIDEVAMQNVGEFAGKKLIDVSREGVDLGSDAEEAKKASR